VLVDQVMQLIADCDVRGQVGDELIGVSFAVDIRECAGIY
jgi:hypothetical protein